MTVSRFLSWALALGCCVCLVVYYKVVTELKYAHAHGKRARANVPRLDYYPIRAKVQGLRRRDGRRMVSRKDWNFTRAMSEFRFCGRHDDHPPNTKEFRRLWEKGTIGQNGKEALAKGDGQRLLQKQNVKDKFLKLGYELSCPDDDTCMACMELRVAEKYKSGSLATYVRKSNEFISLVKAGIEQSVESDARQNKASTIVLMSTDESGLSLVLNLLCAAREHSLFDLPRMLRIIPSTLRMAKALKGVLARMDPQDRFGLLDGHFHKDGAITIDTHAKRATQGQMRSAKTLLFLYAKEYIVRSVDVLMMDSDVVWRGNILRWIQETFPRSDLGRYLFDNALQPQTYFIDEIILFPVTQVAARNDYDSPHNAGFVFARSTPGTLHLLDDMISLIPLATISNDQKVLNALLRIDKYRHPAFNVDVIPRNIVSDISGARSLKRLDENTLVYHAVGDHSKQVRFQGALEWHFSSGCPEFDRTSQETMKLMAGIEAKRINGVKWNLAGTDNASPGDIGDAKIPPVTSLKDLFFIHIPRTGGTAIEEFGKTLGVRWGRRSRENDAGYSNGVHSSCSFWHRPLRAHPKSKHTFCIVRSPLERAVSEYRFTHPTRCSAKGLNEYLRRVLVNKEPSKNDCHFVAQTEFVRFCDSVLCYRDADSLADLLKKAAGKDSNKSMQVPWLRPHKRNANCDLRVSDLDQNIVSLLRSEFGKDEALWNSKCARRR